MSEKKVAMLIIEANLECEKCYRKIQEVLCKLQEKEKISSISYDTKKNTVTVSGGFDAEKLRRKLRCKAREAIKEIKIVDVEKKTEPTKKEPEEKPKPKPSSSSSTTVNVQFTQCTLCYPWPCSDPTHWGHPPPYCPPPPCPPTPKRPCGSCCGGGCGSCGGGGSLPPAMPTPTHMMQPPPMMCAGGGCRGCKGQGCRIVDVEKKPDDDKKKDDKKKEPEEKPKPSSSSSTTVNVQFTQMCTLCYPWPCSDPTHWGHPQPAMPGHHHHPPPYCPPPPCPPTPKRPCGSCCGGGCGSCGGGGSWPPAMPTPTHMMQPPPMMCAGGGCRGCKGQGCRIVQEGRFIYEEYPPPSACSIM